MAERKKPPIVPPDPTPIDEVRARTRRILQTFTSEARSESRLASDLRLLHLRKETKRNEAIGALVEGLFSAGQGQRVRAKLTKDEVVDLRNIIMILVMGVLLSADSEPQDPKALITTIDKALRKAADKAPRKAAAVDK